MKGDGPEADIVISSRIRLARNLSRFPFLTQADESTREEIERFLSAQIESLPNRKLKYLHVDELERLDRQFLVERQLISRELAEGQGARGVAFNSSENVSVMVNEEDHLRMQVFGSGLALDDCWKEMSALDDEMEQRVDYAFSEQFGYLTACPTNVGTGIRVSVMMHLPALVQTKEIQKAFQALHKIGLAVRGLYGEGSQAMGDFYQISNQTTLGRSEEALIKNLKDVIPTIIGYERRIRQAMLKEKKQELHDQVSRAFGILKTAQTISSEETMQLLSSLRMGVNLGLIEGLTIPNVTELFIFTQPAHLQKMQKAPLESGERNAARATFLRSRLASLN